MLVYTKEVFDQLYERYTPLGVSHYDRAFVRGSGRWKKQREILVNLGLPGRTPLRGQRNTDRILIAGCGFSPLLTAFNNGLTTYGTDPSPYIQANLDQVDYQTKIFPFAIPDKRLPKFDWLIDDDVMPGLDDDEIPAFIQGCDDIAPKVVHFVTADSTSPLLNSKSVVDWYAYAPHHHWIDNVRLREVPAQVP